MLLGGRDGASSAGTASMRDRGARRRQLVRAVSGSKAFDGPEFPDDDLPEVPVRLYIVSRRNWRRPTM